MNKEVKAIIEIKVPDWQIGEEVSIFFPDTMRVKGKCELKIERIGKWNPLVYEAWGLDANPKTLTKEVYQCSDCHSIFDYPFKYCPNCGIKKENG